MLSSDSRTISVFMSSQSKIFCIIWRLRSKIRFHFFSYKESRKTLYKSKNGDVSYDLWIKLQFSSAQGKSLLISTFLISKNFCPFFMGTEILVHEPSGVTIFKNSIIHAYSYIDKYILDNKIIKKWK